MQKPIDTPRLDLQSERVETSESSRPSALVRAQGDARVQRRIGLHHIAFLRGYFEGLDIAILADQYLALGRDKKRGLAAKRWIVEELVAAARKQGDAVGARLLRLPAGALPELDVGTSSDAIDLETFREEVDPDGVYSESELVDLLKATISEASASAGLNGIQARRAQRNTRLRHRQRVLLERLEHALAEPPRSHHPVRDWLDAALAMRLARAGVNTLAELADMMTRRGYRWYRHIPRVGEQAAIRILQWMERNAEDVGIALPEHVRIPRKAWSAALCERVAHPRHLLREGIAPIEHFAPRCPTAQSDRAILLEWLTAFRSCPSTYRAYRTQAERLLLWTALERRTGLAAMTTADANAFFAFVTDPDLSLAWRGRKAERQTTEWRPIEKTPSPNSLGVARRILKVAFDYLCAQGHCTVNPFIGSGDVPRPVGDTHSTAQHEDRHPDELNIAAARDHALAVRLALSRIDANAPTRSTLRDARVAVVHTLINATAWPLSTLVRLRAEDVRSVCPIEEGMGKVSLRFDDGKRVRQAQLDRTDLHVIDHYFRVRERLGLASSSESQFLIARHRADDAQQASLPVTPNVMARAFRQYHLSAARAIVAQQDVTATGDPLKSHNPDRLPSLRRLKRRARHRLRRRHLSPEGKEHFVNPGIVVDVRRFISLNPV